MKSQETAAMERRIAKYIEFAQNESEECINRRMLYTVEQCSWEQKTLTLGFETADWMMNPGGVLHGGMMCTMFDITMGVTAHALSRYYTPTVNLSVTFLRPAPNRDKLFFTARATKVGRTFVQLTAEAKSQKSGELCATASATFYCDKKDEWVE